MDPFGDVGVLRKLSGDNTRNEILKALLTSPKMQKTEPLEVNIIQDLETRTQTEEHIVFRIDLGQPIKSEYTQNENIIQHIPVTYLTSDSPSLTPVNNGTLVEPVTYVLSSDLLPDTSGFCTVGNEDPQKVFFLQEVDSSGQTSYVSQDRKLYAVKESQTSDCKYPGVWSVSEGIESSCTIASSVKHENGDEKEQAGIIGKCMKRDEESYSSKTKAEKRISSRKKTVNKRKNTKLKNKLKSSLVKKPLKSEEEEKEEEKDKKDGRNLFELTKLEDNVEQVARRLKIGCECSDSNCFEGLNPDEVFKHRLNIADLTKAEHDMYLMGVIMASIHNLEETYKHKERIRIRSCYAYQGKKVCLTAFLYLQHVTLYQMKRLRSHLKNHGVSPRIHGNRGRKPANTFSLDIYRRATNFVENYIEEHRVKTFRNVVPFAPNKSVADEKPATTKKIRKTYHLPPECTKRIVHGEYKSFCERFKPSQKVMKYSTFTNFLKKQFPNVKFQKREEKKQQEKAVPKAEYVERKPKEEQTVDKSVQVDKRNCK